MRTVELRVKDTLGPAILSFVGRLSCFWKLKVYRIIEDLGSVLCREVVPFLECSLYMLYTSVAEGIYPR